MLYKIAIEPDYLPAELFNRETMEETRAFPEHRSGARRFQATPVENVLPPSIRRYLHFISDYLIERIWEDRLFD